MGARERPGEMISGVDCCYCSRPAVAECGRCGSAAYCGRDCQINHWPMHMLVCVGRGAWRVLLPVGGEASRGSSGADVERGEINMVGFAILTRLLADRQRNTLISPLSVGVAIAMVAEAAAGATRAEIEKWLDLSTEGEVATAGITHIMPPGAGAVASSIWLNKTRAAPAYVELLKQRYGAAVGGEFSSAAINDWVAQATAGEVPRIVRHLDTTLPQAIVLNALWFSCLWVDEFDAALTKETLFYGPDGGRACQMMFSEERKWPCTLLDSGVAGVRIPLSAERMDKHADGDMPRAVRGRVASRLELLVAIDTKSLKVLPVHVEVERVVTRASRERTVLLWLPRTTLELRRTSLRPFIRDMGIKACWEPRDEFPMFLDSAQIYVGDVVQTARLEFDERGAKGSAATAVILETAAKPGPVAPPKPLEIRCDHPFFVGVRDIKTGIYVLAGYVFYPNE